MQSKNYGLGYVDNNNIKVDFLAQDVLHLNEVGKLSLANKFINFTNRYILWYKEACNDIIIVWIMQSKKIALILTTTSL